MTDQQKSERKNCGTCKHEYKLDREYPCSECRCKWASPVQIVFTHWAPKDKESPNNEN